MPQRYKLRLGDGTFLSVDMDGLRAWTHDAAAVAQAVGSQQWRPLKDVLAEEENAARLLRALIPPQPKKEETPAPSETPFAAPSPFTAAPFAPVPAMPPPATPVATVGPEALDLPPFEPPIFGTGIPSFGQPLAFGEPAFGDPPPVAESPPLFSEPAIREPPIAPPRASQNLQVLADETTSASPDINDASLPAIRLKPLDEPREFRSAWNGDEAHQEEDEPRHDQGPLLAILAPLGDFLSRLLAPLGPLVERLTSRSSGDTAASSSGEAEGPSFGEKFASAWSGLAQQLAAAWSGLAEKLAGAWSGLTARFRRSEPESELEFEDQPEDEPEPEPEAARPERAPLPPRSLVPEPASPPPAIVTPQRADPPKPISQLPVVPLAESVGPREPEHVYDDHEPSDFLEPIWFWTQRIVVLALLAAGGYYLYRERAEWLPRTADLGQTVFTAIDRKARSHKLNEQQQQALVDTTTRLPHLTSQTILLLFGQSPTGVMEAPDVFQLAHEAAERGAVKLPPAETQELRSLENELASTLSPPERRRLEEYDEARTRRVIFPFENPYAMALVAKGARALPMAKLERLRALLQQAVAEGLAAQPAASAVPEAPTTPARNP